MTTAPASRLTTWGRLAIGAVGVVFLGLGLRGIYDHRGATRPFLGTHDLPAFLLGGALLHDLIVAPVAILVGLALRRILPRAVRPWALGATYVTATLVVVAWPALRGYGRRGDNGSILPRHYGTGLAVLVAAVWGAALVGAVLAEVRRRARLRLAPDALADQA